MSKEEQKEPEITVQIPEQEDVPAVEKIELEVGEKRENDDEAQEEIEEIILPQSQGTRKKKPQKKRAQDDLAEKEAAEEAAESGGSDEAQERKNPGLFKALSRKMVFCVSLGVFAYALSALAFLMWGYYSSQKEYEQLNDRTVVIGTQGASDNQGENPGVVIDLPGGEKSVPYLEISVDERKLKALNQDYAFYIVIPGTKIQYPVVQGEDNNHYLRYTYSNQENTAGAIALDYRTDRSTYLQSFNTIISGHNRQDGTMFSDLASYRDERFRDENPYIYIVMGEQEYVYEIFAFYEMEPVAVCYNPNTASDIYLNFINENNTYQKDTEVTLEDRIISLYTCNEDSSMRYLCHAVLREVYDLK